MAFELKECEDRCLLRLDESLTVNCARELHQVLGRALDLNKPLDVDLEQVVEFDVSALQLLYAAAQAAKGSGAGLSLVGVVPEGVKRSFVEAGLNPFERASEAVAAGSVQWPK
jgi:anti-anti-sigma regulatory factor